MQKHSTALCVILSLCLGVPSVHALDKTFGGGGYVSYMELKRDNAAREGIDDKGAEAGFQMDAVVNDHFVFSAGLGLVIIDDKDEFQQRVVVEGGFDRGDVSTESSDIEGYTLFAEGGVRLPILFQDRLYVGTSAGYHFIDAERTISNCRDCRDDDIELDGGFYVRPNVGVNLGRGQVDLAYRHYLSDEGVESMVSLSFVYFFYPGLVK